MKRRKQMAQIMSLYRSCKEGKKRIRKNLVKRRIQFLRVLTLYHPKKNPGNGELKAKVINALIWAGLGFFKTLVAVGAGSVIAGATQILARPEAYLLAALIVAGFDFFSYLAIARGIKLEEASTTDAR